jgi:hypothetical protein
VPDITGRMADIPSELLRIVPGAHPGRAEVGDDAQHPVLVPLGAEVLDVVMQVIADAVGDHPAAAAPAATPSTGAPAMDSPATAPATTPATAVPAAMLATVSPVSSG